MRLGIIGYGAIGRVLAEELADLDLTILVRPGREGAHPAATADPLALLGCGLVVEAAGHEALAAHGAAVLTAGVPLVAASVGALADDALHSRLLGAAAAGNTRLIVPPGAVGGVDILAALARAGDVALAYTGRKPPAAWAGSPAEQTVDLGGLTGATAFFTGTAREAALAYPKNANVAATLALAGPGLDATTVRLVADPAAPGNMHEWEATGAFGRVSFAVEAAAIAGNARTSATTAWSLIRAVRNEIGPAAI